MSASPIKVYWMGCKMTFAITSDKKNETNVREMNNMAYFTVRLVFWYSSTGKKRRTPNEDSVNLYLLPIHACGKLRFRLRTFHCARNVLELISLASGR